MSIMSKSFSLNIIVKPKINIREGARRKTVSTSAKVLNISCKVNEANPLATVEWRYRHSNVRNWSLVLSNLRFANIDEDTLRLDGQMVYKMFYKCVANNSLGKDSFTWEVLNESRIAVNG